MSGSGATPAAVGSAAPSGQAKPEGGSSAASSRVAVAHLTQPPGVAPTKLLLPRESRDLFKTVLPSGVKMGGVAADYNQSECGTHCKNFQYASATSGAQRTLR